MKLPVAGALLIFLSSAAFAENGLKPLMVEPGDTVIETDFSTPQAKLDKSLFA